MSGSIHQTLLLAVLAFGLTACSSNTPPAGLAPSPDSGKVTVQDLVPISSVSPYSDGCGVDIQGAGLGADTDDAEMEAHLAVNPANPDNIIAAWMQDIYQGLVVGASRDGGATWTPVAIPGTSTCSGGDYDIAADPWVSFGPDGTAYLIGFSLDFVAPPVPAPFRSKLFVSTSTDGGFTWSDPSVVSGGLLVNHDTPTLTADPTVACTAYVAWTDFATAFGPVTTGLNFSRTSDCGRTWSAPTLAFFPLVPFSIAEGPKLMVQPDGSLVVVATVVPSLLANSNSELPAPYSPSVVSFRSADGGVTWSSPTTVAQYTHGPFHDPETGEKILTAGYIPSANGGRDGVVYAAWRHYISDSLAEIRLSRSADGGVTWSEPVVVKNSGVQMLLPGIAVSDDGTVGVSYYDIRNDVPGDESLTSDLWFSHSNDGGSTWSETHLAGPLDLRRAALRLIPVEGRFVGDYTGLAAAPKGFVAAFALSKPLANSGASDIFFARITTPERAN